MSLTIDLSKEMEAALASRAQAAHLPTERYLAQIVEDALQRHQLLAAQKLEQSLDAMATQVRPATSGPQMEAALDQALTAARPRRSWLR